AAPAKPDSAREMIKLGREALQRGDKDLAQSYATKAQDLKASFMWWEDSPTKLFGDIQNWAAAHTAPAASDAALAKQPATTPISTPEPTSLAGNAQVTRTPSIESGPANHADVAHAPLAPDQTAISPVAMPPAPMPAAPALETAPLLPAFTP